MRTKKEMSLKKYLELYSSEEACRECLYDHKWPNGYECPKCGGQECYYISTRKKYQCKRCKHQTSVTANTIMHRSHLPLTTWFLAFYFVACDKRGISAVALAGKVEVSYETAWYMLMRIRAAMFQREHQYILAGVVEMDDSYFGSKIRGKRGRAAGRQSVMVAVSKDREGHPEFLKMEVTEDVKSSSVSAFLANSIEKGSTVQTDSFNSYVNPLRNGYIHEAENFDPSEEHLLWIHTLISNSKAFLNGTYHGTSMKHLPLYLSEFCYRFNRRFLNGRIFEHLVSASALCTQHFVAC